MGAIELAIETINLKKQALIFVNTKRGAEKTAEDIAKKIKENNPKWERLAKEVLGQSPTKQCRRLSNIILKGVAFHHSGLTTRQRELIENGFRSGIIKIIASTPTLAAGLDLPAFRAIIRDIRRFDRGSLRHIPVLEYLQMAGRAGRPKYDKYGEAILIAKSESEKDFLIDTYIFGEPEDIDSKLAVEPVLRTYLLALISTHFIRSLDEALDFFSRTFWAHQYRDLHTLGLKIEKIISLLEDWDFIEIINDKFVSTPLGEKVSRLYLDPLTAHELIEGLQKGIKINEFSFLQLISYTLEMRPLLNVRQKEQSKIHKTIIEQGDFLLSREPELYDYEYDDFLKSIKTAMMFKDWIDERTEEFLLEEYNIRPGELNAKLDTAEWLLMSLSELALLIGSKDLIKHISKLRLRLRYGAKEELLALLKLKGIGRVYARKLFANGIKDLRNIKNIRLEDLKKIVGKKAISLKEQIGESIKEKKEKSLREFTS